MNGIGKKSLSGTFWLTFSNIVNLALSGGALIYIARRLGPESFGYVPLVAAIVGTSMIFADVGLAPSTARFLAEAQGDRSKVWKLFKRSLGLRLMLLVPVCACLYLVTGLLGRFLHAPLLPAFGWLMALLLFLLTMQLWITKVCEGTGNVHVTAKVNLLVRWTEPALQILLVVAGFGLMGVFVGRAAAYILSLGVFLTLMIRMFRAKEPPPSEAESTPTPSRILAYALPLMVIHASTLIYTQSDILMLKYFGGIEEVSYYGVATRMAHLIRVPAAAFGASTAPLLMLLRRESLERVQETITKSLRYLAVAAVFVSAVVVIYAREIVEILFSARYLSASTPLRLYTIFIFFSAFSAFVSLSLDYSGLAMRRMILVAVSASCNVLLNLILIPRYGMMGAAYATQITFSPLVAIYILLIAKHYRIACSRILGMLLGIIGIGVITCGVLYLCYRLLPQAIIFQILGILIGGSLYLYIAARMNLVKKSELRTLYGRKR
ncbi:MAG: oligosaccharide flippase family protein [bacterium]|nr:MAG: oligosaccharide flippase family protein [bacterium]